MRDIRSPLLGFEMYRRLQGSLEILDLMLDYNQDGAFADALVETASEIRKKHG